MGTFLKYLFYLLLAVAIYLIGRGIYEGSIDRETTVGSVVNQVGEGTAELAKDAGQNMKQGYESVKKDIAE